MILQKIYLKPLFLFLGLPLIERVILTTKEAGINEYVIVVGYFGDKIRASLCNGERLGIRINYIENEEWQKSNGLSVLKAKELLNDYYNFLVICKGRILLSKGHETLAYDGS